MNSARTPVSWVQCSGRDTWDHPLAVPDDMGTECLNVELKEGQLCRKRDGSVTVTLAGDSFTGGNHYSMFVPGQDLAAAELMIVSADATPKILRIASANTVQDLTLTDAIATRPQDVTTATLNKKHFFAYDSTVNRLHVFSPAEDNDLVRRVGLETPAAPTVADQGSGSYPAIERWYSVAYRVKSGSQILRESEASAVTAFTPNATSASARVTKPATINEGETHWVLYASAVSADGPFFELAETVVGTTTYDDAALPSTYADNEPAPTLGTQYPFPSVKFLCADGVRLFGLGVWEPAAGNDFAVAGRLYFTPAIGATANNDNDERIINSLTQEGWIDLNISGGGIDRGVAGPVNGRIYAFQSKGIFMIVPTQNADSPVRRQVISETMGAVSHHSLVIAEDQSGSAALYFLDPNDGPRRIGLGGDIQWLGKDVKDLWDTVNLDATTRVAWGLYHPTKKQVIWWVATGASNIPDRIIVHHVTLGRTESFGIGVRGGWATWTGSFATARHGCMFSATLAASRPIRLVPYVGNATTNLARQESTATQDYDSTNYQGYVESKAWEWGPISRKVRLTDAYICAKAQPATSIYHTLIRDWGAETFGPEEISIAATGTETRVRPRAEAADVADAKTLQTRIGDQATANTAFTIDRWDALVEMQDA